MSLILVVQHYVGVIILLSESVRQSNHRPTNRQSEDM